MSDSGVGPRSAQLIEATNGLARYLRDLVRSSRTPVRHVRRYQAVVWLRDLADDATRYLGAGRADSGVVLALPFEPRTPAPEPPAILAGLLDGQAVHDPFGLEPVLAEVSADQLEDEGAAAHTDGPPALEQSSRPELIAEAYAGWIEQWRAWSRQRREAFPRQTLHESLTAVARKISEHDDQFEAILATGLLTWQPEQRSRIQRHLVTRRVRIGIDKAAKITVRLDPDAPLRLEDRDFLADEEAYRHDRAAGIHEGIAEGLQHPLDPDAVQLLQDWSQLAFDHPVRVIDQWEAPHGESEPSGPCLVTWSPAIILRGRDGTALARVYERIINDLNRPDAQVPLGLAQLVAPLDEPERAAWRTARGGRPASRLPQEPLFPLPANVDQRAVLEKLGTNTAVVVQGPPGTGKTHTIANLTCALLAQGQRVLVTSQKDQALSVLRELIPAQLRDLCVLLTANERAGQSALERTLGAMSDRAATIRTDQLESESEELERRRRVAMQRRAELEEGIRLQRQAEAEVHDPAPGYSGTLVDLDYLVARDQERYGWMPIPPANAAGELPLGIGMFGRLRDLLRRIAVEDYERAEQHLPDLEQVPDPVAFAELLTRIESRSALVGPLDATGQAVARLDVAGLAAVEHLLHEAADALHRLGLGTRAAQWPAGAWQTKALTDALAARYPRLWKRLADTADEAEACLDTIESLRAVSLPDLQPDERAQFLEAAREWRDHLSAGNRPRSWLRRDVQNRVEPFLRRTTVSGVIPSTDDKHLGAIITLLEAATGAHALDEHWRSAGVRPEQGTLAHRLEQHVERARALKHADDFAGARERAEEELLRRGVRLLLNTADRWDAFTAAVDVARDRIHLDADLAELEALAAVLAQRNSQTPAPELEPLQAAVRERDAGVYAQAHAALIAAGELQAAVREIQRLVGDVRSAHRDLAYMLVDDPRNGHWDDLPEVGRAWAWAVAAHYAETHRAQAHDDRLDVELGEVEDQILKISRDLAGAKAWLHCLTRLDQRQRQALAQLRSHLASAGFGDGRYAGRSLAAARDAMGTAQGAVPAWIMPLYQVVETLPAEPDSFDVVIVDEASQVGLDGLFLLSLAPRMIVVGDDKQCVPGYAGGEHQKVYDRLDEYLAGIPRADRHMFKPGMNLYELLSSRFPDTVRLTEHFRCMPEIIGWCSDQFYNRQLKPLRQFGPDRLDPLRVEFVHGAYTEGRAEKLHNPVEAKQLVEKLEELIADPAYAQLSFGVITLQGSAQAQAIERLIAQNIDPPTIAKHGIRVGMPADFQGDERDVVLLSMVTVRPARLLRGRNDQRRFNVAASRAADQLWLFSSVAPERLKTDDLRLSLLSYMLAPPPATLHQPIPDLTGVTADRRHPEFDSLFEQRVYLRIRDRGYTVAPQVAVGAKRIDLVVYGSRSTLAVECDGDHWHGTVEQQNRDIQRELELTRVGWQFTRIRESRFARDPDAALEAVWTALAARGITPEPAPNHGTRAAAWQPIALDDGGPDDESEEQEEAEETAS